MNPHDYRRRRAINRRHDRIVGAIVLVILAIGIVAVRALRPSHAPMPSASAIHLNPQKP